MFYAWCSQVNKLPRTTDRTVCDLHASILVVMSTMSTSYQERTHLLLAYNGPATLRDSSVSLHTFKRRLKTYLFAAWRIPPGTAAAFLQVWCCYIRLLTYSLTYLWHRMENMIFLPLRWEWIASRETALHLHTMQNNWKTKTQHSNRHRKN